jgi:hypothetical protein
MGSNLDAYRAAIGLLLSKCVSVKTIIPNSSTKFCRKFILFLFLRILILHMDMNLWDKLSTALFILLVGNIESNAEPESAYISSTRLSAVDILSDKFISICNINIRSIRNKINFLQMFIYIIFKFVFPANADVFLWVNK